MKINIYIHFLTLALIFIVSCSPKVTKTNNRDLVIFPAPPDTTRIQFLTTISSSKDIVPEKSSFWSLFSGVTNVDDINKPYGICLSKSKIYVVDTKLGCLEIINLKDKTFEYFRPGGLGALKKPMNCFVDENNYLYISDLERKDIVVFDSSLKYYNSFGLKVLDKPSDVFVYKDKAYVSDMNGSRIQVFSKESFKLLNTLPEVKSQNDSAYLHQPTNLYIYDDVIYVTDFGEFNVKKYSVSGKFLGKVGSYGDKHGQLARPKGLVTDRDKNLYIVDAAFENVQIFNPDGRLLMFFGGAYKGPGYMNMPIRIAVDYNNLDYFSQYVDNHFKLKYLIYVTNQFGPDKITVYGFVEPKTN